MKDRLINIFAWLIRLDMQNYLVDYKKKNAILERVITRGGERNVKNNE